MNGSLNMNIENTYATSEWTFQSKWYHFLFWTLYFIFWLIVSWSGGVLDNILFNVVFLFFNVFAVYTVLYYLMPKYLYKQRYFIFVILAASIVILSSGLLGFSIYMIHIIREIPAGEFFKLPIILGPTLGSVSTSVLFFMVAKLVKNFIVSEQRNKTLELEKTENELKFLKSQLNPHFLFNALNNIYFLIKKDPDTAAESLAKFSDMVRYQLYDCNEDKILLSQEIDYINNYVKITSLSKSEITDIQVDIDEHPDDMKISPLILVPLVENAFKHVSENDAGKNYIDISVNIEDNQLICKTINSFDHNENKDGLQGKQRVSYLQKEGGLGLANLQRRLSLLYPNSHSLDINESNGEYSSKLKLQL